MDTNRKMTETISKDGDGIRDQVVEIANNAMEKGREAWNDLRDQGQAKLSKAQKSGKKAWEDTQQVVQRHPGKAVAISLAVGAAIGALFSFRKNKPEPTSKPS